MQERKASEIKRIETLMQDLIVNKTVSFEEFQQEKERAAGTQIKKKLQIAAPDLLKACKMVLEKGGILEIEDLNLISEIVNQAE
jgi:hypothetical protein